MLLSWMDAASIGVLSVSRHAVPGIAVRCSPGHTTYILDIISLLPQTMERRTDDNERLLYTSVSSASPAQSVPDGVIYTIVYIDSCIIY